jgi:hypothetical protein
MGYTPQTMTGPGQAGCTTLVINTTSKPKIGLRKTGPNLSNLRISSKFCQA